MPIMGQMGKICKFFGKCAKKIVKICTKKNAFSLKIYEICEMK